MPSLATFQRPSLSVCISGFSCTKLVTKWEILFSVFAGQVFDIAPEDFLELGQVPTSPMYCIGGVLGSDSLPTPWLM